MQSFQDRQKIIIKRDGYVCRYCNEKLNANTHTIDHIIPASHGGNEHPDNLVMCCKGCNKRAGNLLFADFDVKKSYLSVLAKEARKNKARNKTKNVGK